MSDTLRHKAETMVKEILQCKESDAVDIAETYLRAEHEAWLSREPRPGDLVVSGFRWSEEHEEFFPKVNVHVLRRG